MRKKKKQEILSAKRKRLPLIFAQKLQNGINDTNIEQLENEQELAIEMSQALETINQILPPEYQQDLLPWPEKINYLFKYFSKGF